MDRINDLAGTGTVIENKFGDFEVLRAYTIPVINKWGIPDKKYMTTIRFINSNPYVGHTVMDVTQANITLNKPCGIRDPYQFDVCGNGGCIGFIHPHFAPGTGCKEFQLWYDSIIRKNYLKTDSLYPSFGGQGTSVCLDWRCYEIFLYQLPYIPGFYEWDRNPKMYTLDLDIKLYSIPKDKRVYGLETSMFIPKKYNSIKREIEIKRGKNQFTGVEFKNGKYRTMIHNRCYGVFTTEIAAANYYNHKIAEIFPDMPKELLNDVPYIPLEDLILEYMVR